jgi:hypothetical protein
MIDALALIRSVQNRTEQNRTVQDRAEKGRRMGKRKRGFRLCRGQLPSPCVHPSVTFMSMSG